MVSDKQLMQPNGCVLRRIWNDALARLKTFVES